jgi:hypothetical protein
LFDAPFCLHIYKNRFLSYWRDGVGSPNLDRPISSLNTENILNTVHPNGDTLALPPNDYLSCLADCIEILHRADHELMRWSGFDMDPNLHEIEEEEDGDFNP